MTRDDMPEYFERICSVVTAVFSAENSANEKNNIRDKIHKNEITQDEYIEMVAEELIAPYPIEKLDELK